ncbi:MAG: GntR family transcriptional regulator [Gemmatimonadaceae bacterium]
MTGLRKPIAESLRQRILSGLHMGLLHVGDRLPSVREIASEFEANPRVAQAAYKLLAEEGIVELRRRSGIYVAPTRAAADLMTPRQSDWLADLVIQGLKRGIAAPDLPDHLRQCLATLRLRAVVLECNSDQLWSMTDELTNDYGLDATSVDLDALDDAERRADALAVLKQADVLVTTAYHATGVRRLAEELQKPSIAVTMCTDLFAETQRLLEREPVYYVVDDARMGAKLRDVFSASPGSANLRTLVNGHDDLRAIPANAPVYLTRFSRTRLAGHPLLARALAEARVFAIESAREITAFMIRANLAALMVQAVSGRTIDTVAATNGGPPARTSTRLKAAR